MVTALLAARVVCTAAPEPSPWLLFPVDVSRYQRFTSPFGRRILRKKSGQHSGIDLAAPSGSSVLAAREGQIESIGFNRRAGWFLRVDHGLGWRTVYCHLSEDPRRWGLYVGQWVRAAQALGRVGSTGRSTGPHLHFGLLAPGDRWVDPVPHLLSPIETYRLVYQPR